MKATTMWTVAAAAVTAGLVAPMAAQAGLAKGAQKAANYQTLEQSVDGVWCEPTVVAVESEAGWDQAMQDLAAEGALVVLPAPAAPAVDWSKWTVVLVGVGQQVQRGAGVEVTGARQAGRTLHLEVSLKAGNGGLSGDPYMPHVLVAVEKSKLLSAKQVQLHYTLATPDSYMPAEAELPAEVAVYGSEQVQLLTWGRLKGNYR